MKIFGRFKLSVCHLYDSKHNRMEKKKLFNRCVWCLVPRGLSLCLIHCYCIGDPWFVQPCEHYGIIFSLSLCVLKITNDTKTLNQQQNNEVTKTIYMHFFFMFICLWSGIVMSFCFLYNISRTNWNAMVWRRGRGRRLRKLGTFIE